MIRNATFLGITAVALLAGCKGDQGLSAIQAELECLPQLTDIGAVPVGEAVTFEIQCDHLRGGPISIKNISVTNVEGTFFALDGDKNMELEPGESIQLPFVYEATQTGYHRAKVEFSHNGRGNKVELDVRGQAVLPEATLWPLGLDFGPVDVGANNTRQLTISNQSDLDLTVSEASVSNGVFAFVTPTPFTVGASDDMVVTVSFTPTSTQPEGGTLTLRAGNVELPQVGLRGNDCANGDPMAYDQDGDGYTTCGGDCDDNAIDVHPGAIELGNTVDDDCDGIADEGTHLFDDDGDGYCEGPGTCTDGTLAGDCSDSPDAAANTIMVNPGMTEIPDNGIDDDCDGMVDAGTTDADGDGYSPAGGDCDDNEATVYPGAPELADGLNNDCDLFTDEGTVWFDDDGDGYCEDAVYCSDGSLTGDCDDDISDMDGVLGPDGRPTNPGAPEQPDFRDNNCDGIVDEGTVNFDDDGDGYTEVGGDCNDSDATVSPALGNCP